MDAVAQSLFEAFFKFFLYLMESLVVFQFLILPFGQPYNARWKRFIAAFGSMLAIVGATGFLGFALSASGGMKWLPDSFEWPIGRAAGALTTNAGLHVVPNEAGRVQIYDLDWKFIRGWTANVFGGVFTLRISPEDNIEVFTARGDMHYVYTTDGTLVTSEPSANYPPKQGEEVSVPTPWWLWSFTSVAHSWLTLAAGILFYILLEPKTLFRWKRKGNAS